MPTRTRNLRITRICRSVDCVGTSKGGLKCSRAIKHVCLFRRRRAAFPLKYWLLESFCVLKHRSHINDLRHVPFCDGLVERRRVLKHRIHVRHSPRIPFRNVAVESTFPCKAFLKDISSHSAHVRYQTHVPIRHSPVSIPRCPCSAFAGDFRAFF